MDNYWIYGILSFLFVLSFKKYTNLDLLREWIEDYLCKNPEIFSNINNNKDE